MDRWLFINDYFFVKTTYVVSFVIGSIPRELGNLSQLIVLDLGSNQLTGIWIVNYLLMIFFCLDICCMVCIGSIPGELCNLSQMTQLWLYYNQFSSYPANLFIKMQLLKFVAISINIDIILVTTISCWYLIGKLYPIYLY